MTIKDSIKIPSLTYLSFFILAILLIIFAIVAGNSSLDIHVHDTYYVISYRIVCIVLALLALFYGVVYYFTRRIIFSPILTWLNFISLLAAVYFLLLYTPVRPGFPVSPGRYIDVSAYSTDFQRIRFAIIFFLLAKLFLVVNLIGGMLKRIQFSLQ